LSFEVILVLLYRELETKKFRYTSKKTTKRIETVKLPLGFGKNYFCLAAIQAYISLVKIIALSSAIVTLDGKPLRLKINSPPASWFFKTNNKQNTQTNNE